MAIIKDGVTIDSGLEASVMRRKMESKDTLATKGALYVGTGTKKDSFTVTKSIAPNGADDNGKVLVADASQDVGWQVAKITTANLEDGRVAQATNADNVLVSTDTYKPLVDALLELIYPVGSIYMTVDKDKDPAAFLGGTWERWGQGRVPVGVDENDTIFEEAGKTGGEKQHTLTQSETPTHTHDISVKPDRSGYGGSIYITTEQGSYVKYLPTANSTNNRIGLEAGLGSPNSVVLMSNIGGDKPHNNLQPYITCYMWKRTA